MKNKAIKICILTSVHPVFDTRIFHKEAKTLVSAGFDVTLIVQRDDKQLVTDNRQLVTDNRQLATIIDGVKIIFLPKPKNRFFRMLFLTKKVYKLALKQRADIYHFHDPELLPWVVKLKKKTSAKIIYDIHEDVPRQILSKYWIPKVFRKLISDSFKFYEKRIIKDLDFIIAVGDDVKEMIKKVNSNTETIKNFPISKNFRGANKKKRKKNGILNIIYVGGLTKIRGITQIVKAMEYLSDNTRLMLLGKFSPKGYEKEIKNLRGFKKVNYLGQVPFNKISSYLSQSNFGLICLHPVPNYYNAGEPTKLFEYMIAGLPVVASNFPLWKKIVEGNNCGICVDPLKPKEIAGAIKYLKDNPEKAREMGENGRKAVLEKYNWENESKKLLSIYEKLAKE